MSNSEICKNFSFFGKISIIISLFVTLYSCGGNLKDPMKAPELKGEELGMFLDYPIRYGPEFKDDHVRDIFYSGGLVDGMEILVPRKLGTVDKVRHYVIIIQEKGNLNNNTFLFFEDKDFSVTKFSKLEQGDLTRYQNKMNPILLELFPNSNYFLQAAIDIAIYDEGEPERKAAEAESLQRSIYAIQHPYEYIKNSRVFLRQGIDDVRGTVGELFYIDNLLEGVSIEEPYKSGNQYIVEITITAPTDVVKTRAYLDYDEESKTSLIDKIVMAGNRETQTANTFEEKYQVIIMLLSAIKGN